MENQTLYELVDEYIDRQSLTYVEFAKKIGVSTPTIYGLQIRKPSLKTYRKLAKELNINTWDLRQYPIK